MGENSEQKKAVTPKAVFGFLVYLLLNPIILFVSAGTLKWVIAWVYLGISIFGSIVSRVVAHRKDPGLLEERSRYREAENVKTWDKVLVPIAAFYGPVAAIVLAGLDMRYGWTNAVPLWMQILGLLIGVLGFGLASWAMVENRYFAAVVRIQDDRGHEVCKSGPYRYVRHPGYAGGIVWYLVTPLILNSLWAFVPMMISIIATIIRTVLEDRTLIEELEGYKAFTRETPYRLVPGIW